MAAGGIADAAAAGGGTVSPGGVGVGGSSAEGADTAVDVDVDVVAADRDTHHAPTHRSNDRSYYYFCIGGK